MVYLKKILIFIFAFLTAFFTVEYFTAVIVNYPKYGVDKKVYVFGKDSKPVKMYLPHSEYWTVEGGNKVYKRNNVGLPGIDVNTEPNTKYIFVLGSSFVESLSVPPENMATSRFQMLLNENNSDYSVLNLGSAGYNVYADYYASAHYEKFYLPDKVFLVLHAVNENYYVNSDFFKITSDFGVENKSFKFSIAQELLNRSSFLNLMTSLFNKSAELDNTKRIIIDTSKSAVEENRRNSFFNMEICFTKFKERYGDRFIVVSILTEEDNNKLGFISEKVGINFISKNIVGDKDMRINKVGHLNEKGSKILSELLYEAFIKFYEK